MVKAVYTLTAITSRRIVSSESDFTAKTASGAAGLPPIISPIAARWSSRRLLKNLTLAMTQAKAVADCRNLLDRKFKLPLFDKGESAGISVHGSKKFFRRTARYG
jgi:hypothetical protein